MTGKPEHVFLVAIQIEGDTRAQAETDLTWHLPKPQSADITTPVVCWWIAEDDRTDGSDNDSAVWVDPGAQALAHTVLAALGMTGPWNKPSREGGQFTGTYEPQHAVTRYQQARAVETFMSTIGIGQGDMDLLAALTWLHDNELMDEANIPAAFEALAGEAEYEWHGNQDDHWDQLTKHTQDAVEGAGLLTYTEQEED